jgi:hypothetical protein
VRDDGIYRCGHRELWLGRERVRSKLLDVRRVPMRLLWEGDHWLPVRPFSALGRCQVSKVFDKIGLGEGA